MRALVLVFALAACAPAAEQPADTPPAQTQEQAVAQPQSVEANLAAMPNWEDARAAGVDFRAVGQEPGWLLDIHRERRIVLLADYGESLTEFPLTPPLSPQEGATRYETQTQGKTLVITIRRAPCQDAMSGEAYPSTVEVAIDGRTLSGCGRSV